MSVTALQIDFSEMVIPIEELDRSLLENHREGFIRNCTVDEKILTMRMMERCATHCWVKRGTRLYLELPKEMHYPGHP